MNAESRRSKVRRLILRDAIVVCWVCGQPIDREAPDSDLSIDHVVPRRLGGGHELENLQLAHAACNERRDREDRWGWAVGLSKRCDTPFLILEGMNNIAFSDRGTQEAERTLKAAWDALTDEDVEEIVSLVVLAYRRGAQAAV